MPVGGKVTVFGPHPMLAITVEALTSEGGDDIHLHAAGQGVWVARMAADRLPVAQSASLPPSRHEIDELFSTTVAAALDSGALALCGPYPGEGAAWQCRSIIGANSVSGMGPCGHETTMIGMIQHLLSLGWREQLASTHG